MNTNDQLLTSNAKALNKFVQHHGSPTLTNAKPFLFGDKVSITGSIDHVDVDEKGNHVYEVKVCSEHITADYSIVVIEENSTLNAIKESSLMKCKFNNLDKETMNSALELTKEFMVAVAALVMKNLGYDSVFDLSETEQTKSHKSSEPSNTDWAFLED